jgi:predicted DCC family thiol-disulfide oxidoreductase YuxK
MIVMHPVLLFDGVCNLCNNVVVFIIKRDHKDKFRFAPLQSEAGQKLLEKHNLPLGDFDSFILISNGKIYKRSAAGLRVFKELGGAWQFVYYSLIIFPSPLRDIIYRLVARTRYRIFGKRDQCMIPDAETAKRFLTN